MFTTRKLRQRAVVAGITLVALLVGLLAVSAGSLDASLQSFVYDFAITSYPAEVRNQVTIVAVDDKTVRKYEVYPLPRRAYADLVRALKDAGPRTIAFDVGFYDASPNPEQDRALAEAIRSAGNVILAMQGAGSFVYGDGVQQFANLQLPLPIFRDAAAAVGSVNIYPDDDGRVRATQLVIEGPSGKRYYALPLVATARSMLAARQVATDIDGIRREGDRLVLPGRPPLTDRIMPVDRGGAMSVYFVAKPATDLADHKGICAIPGEFCVVSLADVVEGKVARDLIANRTVLIGAHSISGEPDSYPTPNSAAAKMWGVEIWANTVQSIFTNRYPVRRQSLPVTLISLAAVTAAGMVLLTRFRLYGFLAASGVLAAYAVGSLLLFALQTAEAIGNGPIEVPSIGYVVPAVFWWVVALGYILLEEQIALARTQSTFGRFVTPAVARTILDREESGSLALGGEDKRVTVLFGDIRGFTTLSEGMTPGRLLDTLNRYFEGIVTVVNRYEGTVNKYNGDNIMVLWGAPLEVVDQSRKAVECALEIQNWIVAERAKGGPDVSFGFGINTGHVVAGFLGAKGRMEYTVIGDTANVASRLTSSDIARRDQVAVSGATLGELGDDVEHLDLGAIAVKGRAEPVHCFQVNRVGAVASPNPAPAPERPVAAAAVAGFH